MIEYPLVIQHKGKKIMFYNGNHFGQTGVGMPKWNNKNEFFALR
jgi:hypothetical protein